MVTNTSFFRSSDASKVILEASSTMRNEGVVEGVSDITRDGDAAEGVTL